MTVGCLRDMLNEYSDDMEVVMGSTNSMYVDAIGSIDMMELRSFWGEDRDVIVLGADGQVGAV